ncbi:oligoribonuclease isoform X2 [Aegilops tauschii subsp. strangulata]|nr:oligoribonuclease isoform X2 [Aegilops tauschii subsp. strangulata]
MSKPENMFSLLNLDGEDDAGNDSEVNQTFSTSAKETAARKPDKGVQNDTTVVSNNGGTLASSSGGYRMPLVWIDLEMTGLDISKDRILEIACIVTDGLTERVLQSEISEGDAEKQVLDFLMKHVGSDTPSIAGNSVYVDLLFLKKYMPRLAAIFSHVIVDVSSIMALCTRWYPKERKQTPRKGKSHRAMDDIKESIAELKYYKGNIFKPQKSKK